MIIDELRSCTWLVISIEECFVRCARGVYLFELERRASVSSPPQSEKDEKPYVQEKIPETRQSGMSVYRYIKARSTTWPCLVIPVLTCPFLCSIHPDRGTLIIGTALKRKENAYHITSDHPSSLTPPLKRRPRMTHHSPHRNWLAIRA